MLLVSFSHSEIAKSKGKRTAVLSNASQNGGRRGKRTGEFVVSDISVRLDKEKKYESVLGPRIFSLRLWKSTETGNHFDLTSSAHKYSSVKIICNPDFYH